MCYAKRLAKIRFLIRRNTYYTLWRYVAYTTFLQTLGNQEKDARAYPTFFSQPAFSHLRIYLRTALRNHHGIAPYQQDRYPSVQRRIFTDARIKSISRTVNPAPFSQALTAGNDTEHRSTSRQSESISVSFPPTTSQLDFRSRFDGAVGYNPKKPGRRSYHPLLCFESCFQEFWHGSLRPGNTVAVTGAIPFIKRCLDKVPSTIAKSRVRFRMDSGFYSSRVIGYLDVIGCPYVIVVKEYPHVKRRAVACRFHALGNGWETAEFREKVHHTWKRQHRFIVTRRPIPPTEEEANQLTLFKDKKYAYHVFVTNLAISPWRVYLFYTPRAIIEKNIRELMYDYPLSKIPTDGWVANVAFFQLVLFAANIVHWFKRLCLPKEYRWATLDTIRTDFLVLPARLVRKQGRNIVKLPHDYHYQKEFLRAFQKIESLRLPKIFHFCKSSNYRSL